MDAHGKYPEILEDLAAKVAADFICVGVDATLAASLARRAVELIRRDWGGHKMYIPRGKLFDVEVMRQEIARRWNGTNTRELCREFDITESRLRQLWDEAHARAAS